MGKALWTTLAGGTKPNGWGASKKAHAEKTLQPKTASSTRAPLRRARIKPISPRKKDTLALYAKKKRRFLKGAYCERCQTRKGEHLHHKRGRAGSLLTDERFWIALCPMCHRWVHDNPGLAIKADLLAHGGDWNKVPHETETQSR